MSKAGNLKKAARSNTTAAARKGYGGRAKSPRTPKAKEPTSTEAAAAAAAGIAAGTAAAQTAAGKKGAKKGATEPDYPPPPPIDHSAQATDTPPPRLDKKGNRVP